MTTSVAPSSASSKLNVSAWRNAASACSCVASLPLATSRASRLPNVLSSASTLPQRRAATSDEPLVASSSALKPMRSAKLRAAALAGIRSMRSILRSSLICFSSCLHPSRAAFGMTYAYPLVGDAIDIDVALTAVRVGTGAGGPAP